MTAKPDTSVWEELCIFTDHVLHVLCLHKLVATGRATGLVILQEQARWLRLTNLTTKEKEELLVKEFLVDKINVSGAVVRRTDKEMEMRCEEKREMLALKLWHRFRIPKVDKVQGLSRIHGLGSSLWVDVTIHPRETDAKFSVLFYKHFFMHSVLKLCRYVHPGSLPTALSHFVKHMKTLNTLKNRAMLSAITQPAESRFHGCDHADTSLTSPGQHVLHT